MAIVLNVFLGGFSVTDRLFSRSVPVTRFTGPGFSVLHFPIVSRCPPFQGVAIDMEDLDAVDYSEDPLEGVSIWHSSFPTLACLFSSGYSLAKPSRPPVVLLDDPPTWTSLSTPLASPPSLGFVSACLNPNPGLDPPTTGSISRVLPPVTEVSVVSHFLCTLAPPSGCFSAVPPLTGTLHLLADGLPPSSSNPCSPLESSDPPPSRALHPPPPQGTKKKYKCFKCKADDIFLRLEEDIQWGEVMDFADRVLVGRIRGRNYSAARLKVWAAEVWGHHLVDIPFVETFVRGWFALRFACADHTNWVLSSYWHFKHALVLLKRWTPLFDPETEQIGIGPVWIRLPGLPLQYWSEEIFRRIGNAIGTYMEYDKCYLHTGMMAYTRVLIKLDTRGGLQEFITIQWRDTSQK